MIHFVKCLWSNAHTFTVEPEAKYESTTHLNVQIPLTAPMFFFKAKLIVAGPKVSSITVKNSVLKNFRDDWTNRLTVIDLL